MTPSEIAMRRLEMTREEGELAFQTVNGDRAAFDRLFDRYFNRVAWQLRSLPEREAHAAIWEALEQIFAGLATSDRSELAARAYRITRSSRASAAARVEQRRSRSSSRDTPHREASTEDRADGVARCCEHDAATKVEEWRNG